MICSNCNSKTEGIRLNGKIFCPICGVQLTEPEKNELDLTEALKPSGLELAEEKPKTTTPTEPQAYSPETYHTPEAKIINSENETIAAELQVLDLIEDTASESELEEKMQKEIDTLQAEEKVLDLIKELPKTSNNIIKSERNRIDRNIDGFRILPQEPDPIEEPELPAPEDMLLENGTKEPKDMFDVIKSNETNWEEHKNQAKPELPVAERPQKTTFFTNYLKNSVENIKPTSKKIKKGKPDKSKIVIVTTLIVVFLVIIGLAIYINLYALNPDIAHKKALNASGISVQVNSLPEGYQLSKETFGKQNEINLIYILAGTQDKKITLKISKVEFSKDQLFEKVISEKNSQFVNFLENNTSYWYLDNNELVYMINNFVYQITSSDKITKEELLKISEGVLIENNLPGQTR